MKKTFTILSIVCVAVCIAAVAVGQSPQNRSFMPVDEVRPGMKGTGKTVFEGTTIQDFQVEIMGVLRNVQPKQAASGVALLVCRELDIRGITGGRPVNEHGAAVRQVTDPCTTSRDAFDLHGCAHGSHHERSRQPERCLLASMRGTLLRFARSSSRSAAANATSSSRSAG